MIHENTDGRPGAVRPGAVRPGAVRIRALKPRPRTPEVDQAEKPCGLWRGFQRQLGAFRRWQSQSLTQRAASTLRETAALDSSGMAGLGSAASALTLRFATLRTKAQREAAAAAMGVDLATYADLVQLQHRDITPEDYDTLRNLDTAVKPKTLSRQAIDECAPCWQIPEEAAADRGGRAEAGAEARSGFGAGVCSALFGRRGSSSCAEERPPPCSICLEPLRPRDACRSLPCAHSFHAVCLERWLEQCSDCCPQDAKRVIAGAT